MHGFDVSRHFGTKPNFNLIKKCVEYAKSKNKEVNKELHFTITSNGTLLNDEIIDFLINHKVGLAISLDGPKEIHDRYRVFPNGRGTFDAIVNNIFKIKKRSKEYFEQYLVYNIVIAPPYDLLKIEKFYNEHEDLFASNINPHINLVIPFNNEFLLKNNLNIEETSISFSIQQEQLLKMFVSSIINRQKNKFLHSLFDKDLRKIHMRHIYSGFGREFFLKHLCVPGATKLLVDDKAKFHFCINISSNMEIGDIESGFDFRKIEQIVNKFIKLRQEDCRKCWAIRLCNACYINSAKGDDFSLPQNRKVCESIKKRLDKLIVLYNQVLEKHKGVFDYLLSKQKLHS